MGGSGSGRKYHVGAKDTVDSSKSIDIHYLKKQGLLFIGNSGTLSWSINGRNTGSISYSVTKDGLIIKYSIGEQSFRFVVPIIYSSCNYGGQRPWLQCPGCNRRVGKIMSSGKMFLCRHCGNMAYQSQREKVSFRYLNRAQELRHRLGGSLSIFDPIPWKPKGMHWKTYQKIRDKIQEYQSRSWSSLRSHEKMYSRG